MKHVVIIGGGFGGLGTACLLAKTGYKVTLLEKNEQLGGRASLLEVDGFRFDLGPSWYLMPEIFEHFFHLLGEKPEDHYKLARLSPSYRIFFKGRDHQKPIDLYGDLEKDHATFEAIEKGAGKQLSDYLDKAGYKYMISTQQFLYKNYDTLTDFMTARVMREGPKLHIFKNMNKYVHGYFKTLELQQVMQYPLVFLGASPYNAPALYSLMSHVDFKQGVYYPIGGIYEVTKALVNIAHKLGVKTLVNTPVKEIMVTKGVATGVKLENGTTIEADLVISNADLQFTETKLLAKTWRDHSDKYWNTRTVAPSALLMYLGVKGNLPNISHHNLLFSKDWKQNFAEIFDRPQFPNDPSMYVSAPSKTDPTAAPAGHENLFVLVPIAAGLEYTQEQLDMYADKILETIETEMDCPGLREQIVYKKLFAVKDFKQRYNAFKGTGLGLSHTLKQTAIFRPSNQSKKVNNLYFVGADTNPGIGLPMVLISAELATKRILGDDSYGPLKKL